MFIKSLAVASLFTLSTFAITAQAANSWTVTTQGTISYGFDTTGVFGTAGKDLTGLAFTQSITASTDAAQWSDIYNADGARAIYGSGPGFTDTVTVAGHKVTFSSPTTTFGAQEIDNALSKNVGFAYDVINTYQYASTGTGSLSASTSIYSQSKAFVPTLDFGQTISQRISAPSFDSYTSFNIAGEQEAYFSANSYEAATGSINSLAVNVSPVPEPETYAMLLAGLGLMGLMARRRKTS